jgi:HSP20 family protein
MARSIERYLRLMPKAYRAMPSARLWAPPADVYKAPDGWVVKIELAGVQADELEIEIEGHDLIVRGCRRDTVRTEGFVCQQIEITYSRFEKMVRFPCPIDGARIERDYSDGLLILRLDSSEPCD